MKMLNDAPVAVVLPSTDLNRSKQFYGEKLGLKLGDPVDESLLIFEAGKGTNLVIYSRPEGNKAEHTQASFMVSDVNACVGELESKGVVFEDYDLENVKTVDHVMEAGETKAAWFRDPDGNI